MARAAFCATAAAAAAVAAFGFAPSAAAATTYTAANLVITGGEATAINQCINTSTGAQTVSQTNNCTQIATAGNVIVIETLNITIYNGTASRRQPTTLTDVVATITGDEVSEIKSCATQARNRGARRGRLQASVCDQRGDRFTLSGVDVSISKRHS